MARRKESLRKDYIEAQEKEHVPYTLAHICTTMMRDNRGVVGDEARAVGGSLVAPPIYPTHIQRHLGDLKCFGAVDELVSVGGVPVNAVTTGADLERAFQYGNYRSVTEYLPTVWKKIWGRRKTSKMFSDAKINCARNPESKSFAIGGRRDTQRANNQGLVVP